MIKNYHVVGLLCVFGFVFSDFNWLLFVQLACFLETKLIHRTPIQSLKFFEISAPCTQTTKPVTEPMFHHETNIIILLRTLLLMVK